MSLAAGVVETYLRDTLLPAVVSSGTTILAGPMGRANVAGDACWVADISSDVARTVYGTARTHDEQLTVEIVFSSSRPGRIEVQTDATAAALANASALYDYLKTVGTETLGTDTNTAVRCRVAEIIGYTLTKSDDPDVITQVRNSQVAVTLRVTARV